MIKIATLIYYICVVIVSWMMSSRGFGLTSLEWWVMIFCLIIARTCGYIEGKT